MDYLINILCAVIVLHSISNGCCDRHYIISISDTSKIIHHFFTCIHEYGLDIRFCRDKYESVMISKPAKQLIFDIALIRGEELFHKNAFHTYIFYSLSESSTIVNGPSFSSSIFISAPNTPLCTPGTALSHSLMQYS